MLYQQTIDASGVLRMNVISRLFFLDGTGAAASVAVELTRAGSQVFLADGMKRGLRIFAASSFDSVNITAAPGTVVRFILGMEDVQIGTVDGSSVAVPGGVVVTNPIGNPVNINAVGAVFTAANVGLKSLATLAGAADVAVGAGVAVQIVAADAVNTQREVIIKNLFANAAIMRIAGATAAAGVGHELAPGETITLNTLGAVFAFNTGAAGQSVSVVTNSRA